MSELTRQELALALLSELKRMNLRSLPRTIGLVRLAQCSAEWRERPQNFIKQMEILHGLGEEESHALISLFCIESLKRELMEHCGCA